MLYTRKGDGGTSGLFGTCERFSKDSPVFEALGSVDELNSLLGVCFAIAQERGRTETAESLRAAQECLFVVQAEIAGAEKSLVEAHVDLAERAIAAIEEKIQHPHGFVISGATMLSALLDYARAVARRAERAVVRAGTEREISASTRTYLNRLSSLLYALARYEAALAGAKESSPHYA